MDSLIDFNKKFVADKCGSKYEADKYPAKKIAILTCMDTRLVELLPAALGIKNGDVKMIKNAGAVLTDPFDSTMRSILVAIYELGVNRIMVIGHTECGVKGMDAAEMLHLMKERGVKQETIELIERCGIDLHKWLTGFEDTAESVRKTVDIIMHHPLMPSEGIEVAGFVMDIHTGQLQNA